MPRNRVVRLIDGLNMTNAVYHGHKVTAQQHLLQRHYCEINLSKHTCMHKSI